MAAHQGSTYKMLLSMEKHGCEVSYISLLAGAHVGIHFVTLAADGRLLPVLPNGVHVPAKLQ